MVVGAGVLWGEAGSARGGFDDPFGVHGAQHDDFVSGVHPADGGLGGGVHGEVDAGGVEVAGGEVVEVIGLAEPEGLGLGGGGGEDEAGFMECGECRVAVPGVEGAPGPVCGGDGGGERGDDGGGVLEGAVCKDGELHVAAVGLDDEAVLAVVRGPTGGGVGGGEEANLCEEEAQEAFFLFLVAGDEVVGGGADGGDGFAEVFPLFGEGSGFVVAADFVGAVPGAGAVELPFTAGGDGGADGDAAGEVAGVVCRVG